MTPLIDKSKKLKNLISSYESAELLTFIAGLLVKIPTRNNNPFFKFLKSPLRQLFYLAILNIESTEPVKDKKVSSEEEWDELAKLLDEIEMEYFMMLGFPKNGEETKEDVDKLLLTLPTYLNYFFNGPLSFVEQDIYRIENTFLNYKSIIFDKTGICLDDFIKFFYFVNDVIEYNLNYAFRTGIEWKNCIEKGIKPEEWEISSQEELEAWGNLIQNPGSYLVLDIEKIDFSTFEKSKFIDIISLFIIKEKNNDNIRLYTEKNPITEKPFFKINDKKYLPIFFKQYLNSLYDFLFELCKENIGANKILKSRDKFLETKTKEVFENFLKKEAFYYYNYSVDNNISEQDLLVVFKKNLLIIEMKASLQREPMRDFEKAYKKLESDFEKSIQKGYEQCFRVKEIINNHNKLVIKDKNKRTLYELKNLDKYNIHTIVVTNDRLGNVQTNLYNLLELNENDDRFPWCVNIDDLEVFLLALKKKSGYKSSFINFLDYRELFHGTLMCSDELELCGFYFSNQLDFIKYAKMEDKIFCTEHETSTIFDKLYNSGLGFKNERNLIKKKDKRVYNIFSS
ncbi:hypothetical protein [Empedobacter brevis]|uniref:hypothetical protein n=1 Tax=Empedobacter brevis TaxID=247 RepID=UPI0028CFE5E1|nr:hypothetical protein [Empedobacter brevis]